jgi:hypothetical protein
MLMLLPDKEVEMRSILMVMHTKQVEMRSILMLLPDKKMKKHFHLKNVVFLNLMVSRKQELPGRMHLTLHIIK